MACQHLPVDLWVSILCMSGPLALVHTPYREFAALVRIQRATRVMIARLPWFRVDESVMIMHEDVWKTGVLTQIAGQWAVKTMEPERTRYVFCSRPHDGHAMLGWIVRRPSAR